MKTITVHIFDKGSSASMSETITVSDNSVVGKEVVATKERIEQRKNEIFDNVPFHKYYFEVECFDDLNQQEEMILFELELTPDC